jgi:hypothetical protein
MTQGEYCMLKFDTRFVCEGLIFLTHLLFNFIIPTYLSHQVNLIKIIGLYWIWISYICLGFQIYIKPWEVMKYEMHFFFGWVCMNFFLNGFHLHYWAMWEGFILVVY